MFDNEGLLTGNGREIDAVLKHNYDGKWKKGLKQGIGNLWCLITNEIYKGNFHKGQKSGRGIKQYKDGRIYQGKWY